MIETATSEMTTDTTNTTEAPALPEAPPPLGSILGGGETPIPGTGQESVGSFNPDTLPVELRNEPSLRNFKDWNDLAKSYVHAVKKLGAPGEELIRVPNGGDLTEVYERLGRPEKPEDYQLGGEAPDHFRQFMHTTGLSQDQAGKMFNYMGELANSENEKATKSYEEEQLKYTKDLSNEWGDDYQKNSELARRAFLQFADKDTVKLMEESGFGNHPGLTKMFSRIGKFLSEDHRLMSGDDGRIGGMSPATAESKIKELNSDQDFMIAYRSATHPKHAEAVKEMTQLYQYLG